MVTLGLLHAPTKQWAPDATTAIKNVVSCMQQGSILSVPVKGKSDTTWTVSNVKTGKDELVVSDATQAQTILSTTRKDIQQIYWFVDFEG